MYKNYIYSVNNMFDETFVCTERLLYELYSSWRCLPA